MHKICLSHITQFALFFTKGRKVVRVGKLDICWTDKEATKKSAAANPLLDLSLSLPTLTLTLISLGKVSFCLKYWQLYQCSHKARRHVLYNVPIFNMSIWENMNEKDLGRMNMTKRIYNKYEGGLKRWLTFTRGVNCFGAVSLFCLIRNNPPLYPLALFSLHSFVLSCVLGSTKDRMPHVVLFEVNFWQLKDFIRRILFTQWFLSILQPAYLFPLEGWWGAIPSDGNF